MQNSQPKPQDREELDRSFRNYIGYGRTTLPVSYKGNVYQMCRVDGDFVFVRIDGYSGEEFDVIPGKTDRLKAYVKERKSFSITRKSIAKVEICGKYTDYFTLSGTALHLTVMRGKKPKKILLGIFGDINEFVLRQFLEGTGGEITITKNRAAAPGQAHSAMMLFFNKKCRKINGIMILIAVVSGILLATEKILFTPYTNILTGIGALLPLINFFIYLRFPRLISFIAPDTPKDQTGITRKYVGFYSKFGMPMVMGMIAALGGGSIVTQVGRLFLYGLVFGAVLVALMVVFTREYRYKYMIILGAAAMLLTYPFQTIHLVNRMGETENYATYTATVEEKQVDQGSRATYIGITMIDGSSQELPMGFSENPSVRPGESTVTVHEYRGLLGIKCADVRLND